MFSPKTSLIVAALSAVLACRADVVFHTVNYYVDSILSFNGTLVVPSGTPTTGTPYVWPGLQPPNNSEVLQPVLDGRNSHWYFGNALVGNPGGEYGGGVNCVNNEALTFYMNNYDRNGNWNIGVANSKGERADHTYNIAQQMNQAIFAVELYSTPWTFGDIVFENVAIVALGSNVDWCTANPHYQDLTPHFEGVSGFVAGEYAICNIKKLTLSPP